MDIRQSDTRVLQDQLNLTQPVPMDSTLASINSELTAPGRLIAHNLPSLVVTVGSGTVVNPNTSKNRVLPFIDNTPVNFPGGTITFPSASGNITVSTASGPFPITIGASQFVAVLVQLDTSADLQLAVGAAASSLGAVVVPTGTASYLSLGYIIVESNGSSVIQNVTDAMIYQFAAAFAASSLTFRAPTVQKFLSGSGTYTLPSPTPLYLKVTAIGGGGGGAGSGTNGSSPGGGTAGGDTTFGSSLIKGGGGSGAGWASNNGGAGGTGFSGGSIELIVAQGGAGTAGQTNGTGNSELSGGAGGASYVGGNGGGGSFAAAGTAGSNLTGGGGGGAGIGSTGNSTSGGGGGGGGVTIAIVTSPLSTYPYAVGAGGPGGTAGTGGSTGGNGGTGYLVIEEYYQ
jgi:hypothetical protein